MHNSFVHVRVFILFIGLVSAMSACNPDDPPAKPDAYQMYVWEPVIDSLSGVYFQSLSLGPNGEMFANYWKDWNGPPTSIASDDGVIWRKISSPAEGTWSYLMKHKNILIGGAPDKGLSFSEDKGETWTRYSNFAWEWPDIIRSNNDHLIVADFRTATTYISDDDAKSWRELYPRYLNVIDVQNDKITAMRSGTIIESSDWGKTWTADSSLIVQEKRKFYSVGFGKIDGQPVVGTLEGVFVKNIDNSWTKVSESLPYDKEINMIFVDRGKIVVQTHPDGKFYYSGDLGKTWNYFTQGLPTFLYEGVVSVELGFGIIKRGEYLYFTSDGGFFRRKVD